MMKITVLVDNLPHPLKQSLEAEHGLSIYIDTDDGKFLLDTGASDKFLHNAEILGIEIADVDYLILSHAHKDHTGGLDAFIRNNSKAKIYLSSNIKGSAYYSTRRGVRRDISIDYRLLKEHSERFVFVSHNMQLTPSVGIICRIPLHHSLPMANSTLFADNESDLFGHEMALSVRLEEKAILLSSCTHLGLLNTLEACDRLPSVFIGGMHLVDSDDHNQFETETDYRSISNIIRSEYPSLHIYTGHCTGANARCTLKRLLGEQFNTFYTGYEWDKGILVPVS